MKQTLGILVRSDEYMEYVIKLAAAAHDKGKEVHILFTGSGARLALDDTFHHLSGIARLAICDASFRLLGLNGREQEVPGVSRRDFVSEDYSARMIRQLDRTIVM